MGQVIKRWRSPLGFTFPALVITPEFRRVWARARSWTGCARSWRRPGARRPRRRPRVETKRYCVCVCVCRSSRPSGEQECERSRGVSQQPRRGASRWKGAARKHSTNNYTILWYAIQYFGILSPTRVCYTLLYSTTLHYDYITLYCTILQSIQRVYSTSPGGARGRGRPAAGGAGGRAPPGGEGAGGRHGLLLYVLLIGIAVVAVVAAVVAVVAVVVVAVVAVVVVVVVVVVVIAVLVIAVAGGRRDGRGTAGVGVPRARVLTLPRLP